MNMPSVEVGVLVKRLLHWSQLITKDAEQLKSDGYEFAAMFLEDEAKKLTTIGAAIEWAAADD